MKKNKIKKVSQALTIILEHYLEGNILTEVLPETLEQEVKELKVKTTQIDSLEATVAEKHSETQAEISELKEQIDELRQALINAGLSSLKEKVEDIPKEKIKCLIFSIYFSFKQPGVTAPSRSVSEGEGKVAERLHPGGLGAGCPQR